MPRRSNPAPRKTTPSPEALGQAVRRLTRAVLRLEEHALEAAPVTRAQALVLISIGGMGQPAMSMLARELKLAPSTLTRLVDPLVENALLRREASPDDRRIVVVGLTQQGKRVQKRIEQQLNAAYGRVVALAPAREHARLQRALDGLIEAFEREHLTGS